MSQTRKVLVFGASGYLGQFITVELGNRADFTLSTTFQSHALPLPYNSSKVDFTDPKQVRECITIIKPDVIINTVAISNIKQNDENPELATKINVPQAVVDCLTDHPELASTLFIHFSTDQGNIPFTTISNNKSVFDGSKKPAFYKETDTVNPLHVYGKTKVEAENLILNKLPTRSFVLRTSVIYGKLFLCDCVKHLRRSPSSRLTCSLVFRSMA
jgi:dTDP-4-dehydrorhamnose reductase